MLSSKETGYINKMIKDVGTILSLIEADGRVQLNRMYKPAIKNSFNFVDWKTADLILNSHGVKTALDKNKIISSFNHIKNNFRDNSQIAIGDVTFLNKIFRDVRLSISHAKRTAKYKSVKWHMPGL